MHNNGHANAEGHGHDGHGDHGHGAPESFIRKYVFSVDHKVIGIQYGITALVFLFLGFCLILLMRWQLAYPEQALPVIGRLFGVTRMPEGVMLPEFYNQLGAMHGTIMVFLGVVPLAVGAFGNYLVPLQVGAPDMAFPKLNAASYWLYFVGGVIMLISFFIPGGAAKSGWTSYPPLAVIETAGQTWWLLGMVFLINSSLLGSVNIITTIVQLRAPGLKFMRLPFFVWAQLVTSLLLLLAFPPLEVAGFMQLLDRVAGTSFFMPSGLVISGEAYTGSGGGNALLWQHLFWFLAHPEVYVLILPAMGIVCEVLANNSRKAAVRLQGAGLLGDISRLHELRGVGAPHVPDRYGHRDQHFLPAYHHDHFGAVDHHPDGDDPVAVGGLDTLHHADAVRAGVHSDVWHRRTYRPAARPVGGGHPPARTPTT